jgi:hypothetical protein
VEVYGDKVFRPIYPRMGLIQEMPTEFSKDTLTKISARAWLFLVVQFFFKVLNLAELVDFIEKSAIVSICFGKVLRRFAPRIIQPTSFSALCF